MSKEYFDLIVVLPLEDELQEAMKVFNPLQNRCTDDQFRYEVDSGAPNIRMLLVQQGGMGKGNAVKTASTILEEFDCGIIVCMGIAGSLSGDAHLCDVCYTGTIVDVYDNSKASDGPGDALDLELSPTHYQTPTEITVGFNFIRTLPELRPAYEKWREDQFKRAQARITSKLVGRDGKDEVFSPPRIMSGALVCGAVSKSEKYNSRLKRVDRKLLAIETESGGIFQIAQLKKYPP